jgi:F0F1-type ATP synthase epsilon subunit
MKGVRTRIYCALSDGTANNSPVVSQQEERILATKASEAQSNVARARAEATFKKEERAKEGAKAMMEYQTNAKAVREKIARLRALRLAKETADKGRNG